MSNQPCKHSPNGQHIPVSGKLVDGPPGAPTGQIFKICGLCGTIVPVVLPEPV